MGSGWEEVFMEKMLEFTLLCGQYRREEASDLSWWRRESWLYPKDKRAGLPLVPLPFGVQHDKIASSRGHIIHEVTCLFQVLYLDILKLD